MCAEKSQRADRMGYDTGTDKRPHDFHSLHCCSISILLREFSDTGIILAVIALNTTVGVIQEGKARKAMEALKKMTAPSAIVKRDGVYQKIPAARLVKGDVVQLKAGNQVPETFAFCRYKGSP